MRVLRPAGQVRARSSACRLGCSGTRGEVDEVLAGVAVVGQRRRLADLLAEARLERARERLELVAGVVDVELGRHRAPGAQETRQRVPDGGRARVDDDERTGRFAETNSSRMRCPACVLAASVRGAAAEDFAQRARAPRRGEEDVDEAGPGDLDASTSGIGGKCLTMARRSGAAALGGARQRPSRRWSRSRRARSGAGFPAALRARGNPAAAERRPHGVRQSFCQAHHKHKTPRGGGGQRHYTASVGPSEGFSSPAQLCRVVRVSSRSASHVGAATTNRTPHHRRRSRRSGPRPKKRPPGAPTLAILPCVTPESM